MTQIVTNILDRFKLLTQDDDLERWTRAEVVEWLNEAYLQVVTLRPDATATRATVNLKAGAYQNLDDAATVNLGTAGALIKVVRNIGGSSTRAIRYISQYQLDENIPDWYAETESGDVERWSFDPDIPREFLVYPPAIVATQVEVIYSADPGAHVDGASVGTEELKIRDKYAMALLDYILYRAYGKDADEPKSAARSLVYYQTFTAGLVAKGSIDAGKSVATN